jgi:hypothetical protein
VRNCTDEEKGSFDGSSFSLVTSRSLTALFFASKESRLLEAPIGFRRDQEVLLRPFCEDPGSRFFPSLASLLKVLYIVSSPLLLSLSSFSDSRCISFFALADMNRPLKRVPLLRWSRGDVAMLSFPLIPETSRCSSTSVSVSISSRKAGVKKFEKGIADYAAIGRKEIQYLTQTSYRKRHTHTKRSTVLYLQPFYYHTLYLISPSAGDGL